MRLIKAKLRPSIYQLLKVACIAIIFNGNVFAGEQKIVVDLDWVQQKIHDTSVLLIDVRPAHKYHSSHITNAVSMPMLTTFSRSGRTDLIASIPFLQRLFSNAGIDNNRHIILYSDDHQGFFEAARVFWVLESFGINNVSVMNGSFSEWERKGFSVSKIAAQVSKTNIIPNINPHRIATLLSVRASLNKSSHILIDARPPEHFNGLKSKTGLYGHIPGAINIPATSNLTADGIRHLPLKELNTVYKNIEKNKITTTYCNTGKYSALTYLSLRRLGVNVRAYDGSWYEWSLNPNLPIINPSQLKEN